jgi:hypothetical protein
MKLIAAITVILAVVSCGNRVPEEPQLIELQRVRSGELDVILLSQDGSVTDGKDAVVVEFRRGDTLTDVGAVKGFASMPMAGLPDMMGSAFLEPSKEPGRYNAELDLSMSGGWQLKLEWDGPAGRGKASIPLTAE